MSLFCCKIDQCLGRFLILFLINIIIKIFSNNYIINLMQQCPKKVILLGNMLILQNILLKLISLRLNDVL